MSAMRVFWAVQLQISGEGQMSDHGPRQLLLLLLQQLMAAAAAAAASLGLSNRALSACRSAAGKVG